MSYSTLNHVSEIIKFVAQILFLAPSSATRPWMRVLWILSACCIKISVRFLSSPNNIENTINISFQFIIGISLQDIACTLNRLVWICIVETIRHQFGNIIVWRRMRSPFKVLVAALTLAFAECQRNGDFT